MYIQKSQALLDYNEFPILFFLCCQHSKIKTHSHDHHDHFMHQCSTIHPRDDHFGIHQFSALLYDHHDHFMHQCNNIHLRDDHFGIYQFSALLYDYHDHFMHQCNTIHPRDGEIIRSSGGPRHLSTIPLKNSHLFKIVELENFLK